MRRFFFIFGLILITGQAMAEAGGLPDITCQTQGEWKEQTGGVKSYNIETVISNNVLSAKIALDNGETLNYKIKAVFKENGFFDVFLADAPETLIGKGYCHYIQCIYQANFGGFTLEESLLYVHKKIFRLVKKEDSSGIKVLNDICKKS